MLPAVTVHCPNPECPASGVPRRVMLRQPTPGVVEHPGLLCARCGWALEKTGGWPDNEETNMPKITRHGGPSNQFEATWEDHPGTSEPPEQVPADAELTGDGQGEPLAPVAEPIDVTPYQADAAPEGGEEPSAGSNSSTSNEKPSSKPEPKQASRPSPAPKTGSRSKKAQTGSRSAGSTGGGRTGGTSATSSDN